MQLIAVDEHTCGPSWETRSTLSSMSAHSINDGGFRVRALPIANGPRRACIEACLKRLCTLAIQPMTVMSHSSASCWTSSNPAPA